jgi:hypothetical protein
VGPCPNRLSWWVGISWIKQQPTQNNQAPVGCFFVGPNRAMSKYTTIFYKFYHWQKGNLVPGMHRDCDDFVVAVEFIN